MGVEVVAQLASQATGTVVGLAVTEAWTRMGARIGRLFGRRREDGTGEAGDAELQLAVEQLAAALQADDPHALGDAADRLRRRLRHALREGSGTARELVELLHEWDQDAEREGERVRGQDGERERDRDGLTVTYDVPPALRPHGPPSEIPALRTRVVNRTDELADLDRSSASARAEASRVDVRVLAGPPGVGKSALAWHWAHRMRRHYPDGRIYVDFAALRARSEAGADVLDAVGHCLRALRVADSALPASLAERTALFRSRTAELRVLLVLDDVTSPAQVRALIPDGPGSAVLATSTAKLGELSFDGARPLPLGPLAPDAALLLLADRCGEARVAAEPEAARRVTELCAGFPVALHVAAARLLNERRLTLSALADELADEERRLAALRVGGESPVSAVLDSAYRRLRTESAHGYRLLGRIPGLTFDAATAGAALGTDAERAQVLLDVLEDSSLLEVTDDRRYRFHDLVRDHARARGAAEDPPDTEQAVVRRVLAHCLALTAFADRAVRADRTRVAELGSLLAGRANPFEAHGGPRPLDWLAAERANIMALLRAVGGHPPLHTQGWQLAEGFTVLFLHHRHLGDWQESLELGARYAEAAVAPAAEARLRSLRSRPLMDLGEYEAAGEELAAARACAEVAGDVVLEASVLEFSGRYWDRFDPDRAVEAYRRSMELNERGGEPRGAAIAAFFLGRALDARGDPADALATLRQARADLLARSETDRRMAARASAAIGRALDHLGRTDEAVATLREAARTLRECEGYAYEAEALLDLAEIAERPGADRSRLCADLSRALTVHEEMGSPSSLVEELRRRLRAAEG